LVRPTAILARVERYGAVTVNNLIREPEFGWGPTMLACWRAVLSGRRDEALALIGGVGSDGPMRVRAMQAFLVECRMRHVMGELPSGTSVSPALDLVPAESWADIMRDWAAWSRERGIDLEEAIERALAFWATVKIGVSWKASFLKGFQALTEDRVAGDTEVACGI
jgi:hypothetical protein